MASAYEKRFNRIARIVALLVGLSVFGMLGYHFLEGWPLLDSLYMTIITLTTVGFGEVRALDDAGRWFTIVLMISSVGIVAYSVTTLGSLVVEAEFRTAIWRRRMEKRIHAMTDHDIVCGWGRTGRAVCQALERAQRAYVVIEHRPEQVAELKSREIPLVVGDASADESLHAAGIERAVGLIAALANDAENVYLVLSARQLNSELRIVSWADTEEAEQKVRRAGADYVLSPYILGGARMVQFLLAPHALHFLDRAIRGGYDDVRLDEIEIQAGSALIGDSLKGRGIGREIGVIVIGVARAEGEMLFNPPGDYIFSENDVLIGIGSEAQFARLRKRL